MTAAAAAPGPGPEAEEHAQRAAVHTFRPRRSLPVFIVGTVVLAVAGTAAAEVVSHLVGSPLRLLPFGPAAEYAGRARWNDPGIRVASAVLIAAGAVLIALALVPGRVGHLPLRTGDADLVVGLSRPGLRRAAAAAVRGVDGVHGARVAVGRRRVTVRVRTHLRGADGVRAAVQAAVEERIADLDPVRTLKVRTRVDPAKP